MYIFLAPLYIWCIKVKVPTCLVIYIVLGQKYVTFIFVLLCEMNLSLGALFYFLFIIYFKQFIMISFHVLYMFVFEFIEVLSSVILYFSPNFEKKKTINCKTYIFLSPCPYFGDSNYTYFGQIKFSKSSLIFFR